jgi:hypothetical protein
MQLRAILLALLIVFPSLAQRLRSSVTLGGSGDDSINAAAVDSAGNIYVVGTTFSFDFPARNALHSANSGTQLIVSTDAGTAWKPLGVPFPSTSPEQAPAIAVDPTNSQIVYAALGSKVCKSSDGGHQFQCTTIAFASFQTVISSLAVDPQQPLTIYLSASVDGGVYKSVDGGQTWSNASQGLPEPLFIDSVTIDPFHANVLYAWAGSGGYVSSNGAGSWSLSTMLSSGTTISGGLYFSFDPVTPGIIYGPAFSNNALGVQKSTDGGVTWTQLNTPFSSCCVVPDPIISGILYTLAPVTGSGSPLNFWKSSDGGVTWKSSQFPFYGTGPLVVDPTHPQIMLAGTFRSSDGGQTWHPTNASRVIQPAFAPSSSGLVYATAPITSDAFLAKFLPDGKTLVFSTYFGGMGNDTGQGIALSASGDIWITGSTSSYDLPVAPGAYQNALKGPTNAFAAKFSNEGKLVAATYLGGSGNDSGLGIAIGPHGNPWLIGSWNSLDFPFTAAPQANSPTGTAGFLAEFDPSAELLLHAVNVGGAFDGNGKGIAIDSSGDITLTGSVYSDFSITPGAFHAGNITQGSPKAFVLKLLPSLQVIYSTFFGGTQAPLLPDGSQNEHDYGVAVAVDDHGNAYITGNTSAMDFPSTAGAYQTSLADGCAYPAFSIYTGMIGTIDEWYVDDVFVVKLSPDGKTALFSTLLGGSCYDRPTSIALDATGQIYVTGETDSIDFPLTVDVGAPPSATQFASFVSVFNPAGSVLAFSSYLYAGAGPTVSAGPDKSILVAGSSGMGAQSQPDSGFFSPLPAPFPATDTDGSLSLIDPKPERHSPQHR